MYARWLLKWETLSFLLKCQLKIKQHWMLCTISAILHCTHGIDPEKHIKEMKPESVAFAEFVSYIEDCQQRDHSI